MSTDPSKQVAIIFIICDPFKMDRWCKRSSGVEVAYPSENIDKRRTRTSDRVRSEAARCQSGARNVRDVRLLDVRYMHRDRIRHRFRRRSHETHARNRNCHSLMNTGCNAARSPDCIAARGATRHDAVDVVRGSLHDRHRANSLQPIRATERRRDQAR